MQGSYSWLLYEFDLFLGNYWVSGIIWSLCLRNAAGKLGYLVVRNKGFTAGRQTGIMRCCKDDPGLFCWSSALWPAEPSRQSYSRRMAFRCALRWWRTTRKTISWKQHTLDHLSLVWLDSPARRNWAVPATVGSWRWSWLLLFSWKRQAGQTQTTRGPNQSILDTAEHRVSIPQPYKKQPNSIHRHYEIEMIGVKK